MIVSLHFTTEVSDGCKKQLKHKGKKEISYTIRKYLVRWSFQKFYLTVNCSYVCSSFSHVTLLAISVLILFTFILFLYILNFNQA